MAQSTLQSDDYGGYDITTPEQVYAQQQANYNQEMQSPNATQRSLANIRAGVTGLFGGGPQMDQAKAVRDRMQSIMSQVGTSDPTEDPITHSIRVARALSTGMVDISPQIASQANAQLVKLEQAQKQQGLLSAQANNLNAEAAARTAATQESKLLNGNIGITSASGTGNIFRTINMYDSNGNIRPEAAQEIQAGLNDAKQSGINDAVPMDLNKYAVNKGMLQAEKDRSNEWIAMQKLQMQREMLMRKGLTPSSAESTQYGKDADSMHLFATSTNGMLDLFNGMTGPDGQVVSPGSAKQTFQTWLSNKVVDFKTLTGNMDTDALQSINNEAARGPAYQSQLASMAWQLARSNFTGRITNQEIMQAKTILSGMGVGDEKTPANPKLALENLSQVVSQKYQGWDQYVQDHPKIAMDPIMGQYNQQLHGIRAQEGTAIMARMDALRKQWGMQPMNRGGLGAPNSSPQPTAASLPGNDYGDAGGKPEGSTGTIGNKKVVVKNGRIVDANP
jgi:hypothetical protein